MTEFKINIGDKETKKTYNLELKSPEADNLLNKKIHDKIKGELIGLNGYELEISGGSDNSGFPMVSFLDGFARKRVILSRGKAFRNAKRKYQKKRRTVRGRIISSDTAQINLKIVKRGKESVPKLLGIEPKPEQSAEKTTEEAPKQEKPVEEKEQPKPEQKEKSTKEPASEQSAESKPKASEKKKEEPKPEQKPETKEEAQKQEPESEEKKQ